MSNSTTYPIKILPFGPKAIVINWPAVISKEINANIIGFNKCIHDHFGDLIIESVCTYCSLTLYLNKSVDSEFIKQINQLYVDGNRHSSQKTKSINWNIPVCYDLSFGLDLGVVTKTHSLSVKEVIELHTEPLYHVYFLGFLPGFPYLGGLNKRLYTLRLKSPRTHIPKGSVAIGNNQTGIYPSNSPGGWNIIGRSPINFFNQLQQKPALFTQGDTIKFHAIDFASYESLLQRIMDRQFSTEELITGKVR